jgi:D-alanyl-lipoteichoic acid acyltransferase DltB (MBOAT superfamily)
MIRPTLFIVTLFLIMFLPALIAAYGERFVDIVSAAVRIFFLPITWPIKKIGMFLTKEDVSSK